MRVIDWNDHIVLNRLKRLSYIWLVKTNTIKAINLCCKNFVFRSEFDLRRCLRHDYMNCIFIWVESVPGLNMLAVFLYAGALKSVQCSWFYCLNHDLYFYYPRPLYILYFYPPDLSRWKSKYWMLISPPGIEDGRLHDPAVVLSLQCVQQ